MSFRSYWRYAGVILVLLAIAPQTGLCQWQHIGPDSTPAYCVIFRAGDSDTAYAAVGPRVSPPSENGIHRSIDGGLTWSLSYAAPVWTRSVTVDPVDKDVVYLVCQTQVYKSVDAGETWERKDSGIDLHIGDQFLRDVAINHCHPESVYIAMYDFGASGGLWLTSNGGESWDLADMPARLAVATSASRCGLMYTAAGGAPGLGVHRSLDGGATWDTVHTVDASDVAIDPQDENKVYVAYRQIYRSLDGGTTWDTLGVEAGLTEYVDVVAVNPANPAVVYAGGTNAMFRSTDHGATWSAFDDGLPASPQISEIAVEGESGEIILVGTFGHGIYRRTESLSGIEPKSRICTLVLAASPNPFRAETWISFQIPSEARTSVVVYDVRGRLLQTLHDGTMPAGDHVILWNGGAAGPGIYFVELRHGLRRTVKRVALLD